MWQIALACAAAFAAAWATAVVVAALGLWVPAVPLLAAAAAAWAAACALTAAWSRGRAWWAPAHTVGGVTVAVAASIAWFGALFSALLAHDPAALASAALDGWSPYALAIDVARSGIGEVLPLARRARRGERRAARRVAGDAAASRGVHRGAWRAAPRGRAAVIRRSALLQQCTRPEKYVASQWLQMNAIVVVAPR